MAAKKSKTSKKSAGKRAPASAEGVTVLLDTDTILTLKAAVDAMNEFVSAVLAASEDPIVRGVAGKGAKSGKKSAARKAK